MTDKPGHLYSVSGLRVTFDLTDCLSNEMIYLLTLTVCHAGLLPIFSILTGPGALEPVSIPSSTKTIAVNAAMISITTFC